MRKYIAYTNDFAHSSVFLFTTDHITQNVWCGQLVIRGSHLDHLVDFILLLIDLYILILNYKRFCCLNDPDTVLDGRIYK